MTNAIVVLRIVLRVVKSIAARRPESDTAQLLIDAIEVVLAALDNEKLATATASKLTDEDRAELSAAIGEIKSVD